MTVQTTFAGPADAARAAVEAEQRIRLLETETEVLRTTRDAAYKAFKNYMDRAPDEPPRGPPTPTQALEPVDVGGTVFTAPIDLGPYTNGEATQ